MRIKKLLFVLVAFALSIACIMPLATAFAGTSSTEIGSMNNSQWSQNKTDDDVSVWGNKDIKFTADTDANATNVTSQAYASKPDAGATYYSSIDASLRIDSFANADSYFAIAYGFSNKNQKIGQANTFEIYFKQGGSKITYGIRTAGGTAIEERVDAIALKENVNIKITIGAGDNAGKFVLDVTPKGNSDEEIAASSKPAAINYQFPTENNAVKYPSGRVGFGQKGGKNIVTVTSISVIKYEYLNPKNAEFTETFEPEDHANGAVGYNGNLLYTEAQAGALSPSYLEVQEDESGNSYLRFSNTGFAYFVTRDEYSNWAMTFDMFDIVNKRTYDSNGKLVGTPLPKLTQHFGITSVGLTGFRAHNIGAQGGAHIGWIPTGATNDWESDNGKYVMLLTGGVYHYRNPASGWVTMPNASSPDYAHRNLADLERPSMGANPNQYTGAMKVRFELIDGVYRMWFNRADTFDAFFGTVEEYIAAGTNPSDPTEIVIKDFDLNGDSAIDAADYALRKEQYGARYGIADDTELTEDDYWAASEPYMTADIGRTPSGKIMFGVEGSPTMGATEAKTATASFSVDNIRVMNKDNAASKQVKTATEIGYKVNGWPQREETHYDYNEFYNDNDLLGNKIQAGATGGITLVDLIIILVCAGIVVGVGVAAVLIILKNKPKAEVAEDIVEVVEESNDSVEE